MKIGSVMEWLMEGEPSIKFQVMRDLQQVDKLALKEMQKRITEEGWGKRLLDLRDNQSGMWGDGIYSPKWISTHYTLLQLKDIGFPGHHKSYAISSKLLLDSMWYNKGKVNSYRYQDDCICAMIISICCYAGIQSDKIPEIIDYLLSKQFTDGGWNCAWQRGAIKSSVHTTLSVLEAFRDYEEEGYIYRLDEIKAAIPKGQDFLLRKRLFHSERTGEIIHKQMLALAFPCRWKYDILRCLDYFGSINKGYDPRMEEAIEILISKKKTHNRWTMPQRIPGVVHFDMEKAGSASRWNTLRVLRVLKLYRPDEYQNIIIG